MTEGNFEIQELIEDIAFQRNKIVRSKLLKCSIFSLNGCFQIPFCQVTTEYTKFMLVINQLMKFLSAEKNWTQNCRFCGSNDLLSQ